MWRLLAIGGMLFCTAAAPAAELMVTTESAVVRSGPSDKYYATSILRKGDRIDVVGERNGYLEIKPPAGSFSLIRKEHIDRKPGGIDVVNRDGAETLVGSTLGGKCDVRGLVLSRGTLVSILEESEGFYKIAPANEVRYIALDAVRPHSAADFVSGPPPAPADTPGSQPERSNTAPLLQQAEDAYQMKDWQRARQLFQTLARSDDYETRLFAQNRLEFIGRLAGSDPQQPPAPMHVPLAISPQLPRPATRLTGLPKPASTYAYDLDRGVSGPGRPAPAANPAAPVKPPPPSDTTPTEPPPRAKWTPGQPVKKPTVTDPPTAGEFREPGRLRRAFVTDAGRTLYFLEDSRGKMRCYFAADGLDPSPYLNHLVQVWGTDRSYRADLRGDYFIARHIELLGD